MAGHYNLSDFSNKFLDRIGEIYYSSIKQKFPDEFNAIKQLYVDKKDSLGRDINSYEEKLKSVRGKKGHHDVSISEIVHDFLIHLGSTSPIPWDIIINDGTIYYRERGGSLYILYSPPTFSENALSLFLSSPRELSSDPSQFTTLNSLPRLVRGPEVSLKKGGKKRSKRKKTKRRKSRK